jgi:hypothetical protein
MLKKPSAKNFDNIFLREMIGLLEKNRRDEFSKYDFNPIPIGDVKTFNPIS